MIVVNLWWRCCSSILYRCIFLLIILDVPSKLCVIFYGFEEEFEVLFIGSPKCVPGLSEEVHNCATMAQLKLCSSQVMHVDNIFDLLVARNLQWWILIQTSYVAVMGQP